MRFGEFMAATFYRLGLTMDNTDTNWVHFTQTHWSVVLSAKEADAAKRHQALDALCRSYWPPIYGYIRQQGYRSADAQDLTQTFFAQLLEKDYLNRFDHAKGRFRTFLLACLNHLLKDERVKHLAQKRGGGRTHINLDDFVACEAELTPKSWCDDAREVFDRHWAKTILKRSIQRLASDYEQQGKAEQFQELKGFASGSKAQPPYDLLAKKLNTTPEALRAAVHRLRSRFGYYIREEVRQTIDRPEELQEEIRYLILVVSKK